jgi:hypothetical protein
MTVGFDLTCWYLNARRVAELVGRSPSYPQAGDEQARRIGQIIAAKNSVVQWLQDNSPASLEVLLSEDQVAVGSLFTHHSNFFFSGLSKVAEARRKSKQVKPASAYSKLEEWRPGGRVEFEFHDEHLTAGSSWTELAGQKRMFVLGLVTDIQDTVIKCLPIVIGNIVDPGSVLPGDAGPWHFHLELHVDRIDTFSKAEAIDQPRTKAALTRLKDIPEAEIKKAFAEIIDEPTVPKDWGGESSDLFSSRVVVQGQRVSTAFLLKGPAKFHPMTPADLGKNGDQIGRLFNEPADLLVLQHCHEVTTAVRKQMRAYAQQMGNPRRFCIIDGYDTLRILQAYGKCGFSGPQEGGE